MSNIDKQALREELSNPAIGSKDHLRKLALSLLDELEHYKSREERVTKLVLDNSTSWDALYKKLEAAEKRIAEQREYYEGVIADGSKRIAELEARTVTLPDRKSEIFWPGDAYEFDSLGYVIAVKSAIHAAGIQIIEEGKTDGQ
ncbi:ead/Ea22-like family protein [Salmonella enterica subsp. enterica serovar Newport]|nr:ead/Ea22-like family protein [Salmonella enterica subsp. enterica serovar Newport]ECM5081624.1 ead/Ea22-like family protein [Salmonella enterica subsp. enterica serovar Newport]EDV9373812.1 ead/Ea22-like family protein [Salmonella enterica subsp. enterica serovar Bovismorbificans]